MGEVLGPDGEVLGEMSDGEVLGPDGEMLGEVNKWGRIWRDKACSRSYRWS